MIKVHFKMPLKKKSPKLFLYLNFVAYEDDLTHFAHPEGHAAPLY
jgi:hypothetical protein